MHKTKQEIINFIDKYLPIVEKLPIHSKIKDVIPIPSEYKLNPFVEIYLFVGKIIEQSQQLELKFDETIKRLGIPYDHDVGLTIEAKILFKNSKINEETFDIIRGIIAGRNILTHDLFLIIRNENVIDLELYKVFLNVLWLMICETDDLISQL